MNTLFVHVFGRMRSFRKEASRSSLPLIALLLTAVPASVPAQEAASVPNPKASGASAKAAAPTNEIPYHASRYPLVQVRHVPGPAASPELLRAAREGRRTPAVEVDGVTPKGGKLIRVDESYMIPDFAPPLANTNAPLATPSASQNTTNQGCK